MSNKRNTICSVSEKMSAADLPWLSAPISTKRSVEPGDKCSYNGRATVAITSYGCASEPDPFYNGSDCSKTLRELDIQSCGGRRFVGISNNEILNCTQCPSEVHTIYEDLDKHDSKDTSSKSDLTVKTVRKVSI